MKSGPIILIEDDAEDKEIFEAALKDIQVSNTLIWFQECKPALDYLCTSTKQPFVIFSDINLPKMNGIEFKKKIDADKELRKKSIPFVFYTTSINRQTVKEAYIELSIQGFFKKQHNYEEIKQNLKLILDYWRTCSHPNSL